jgi:structural maintenance of chromosome 3 (chondroitin sulfate proteoglycan 6)
MSAYVEVIFDNSDDRFPTGRPELILRRTIGLKKDEYSLDRKNATKSDVMNLLESAGFSRSNPYYIVPQGRVTALTNMKDAERLNILKEVAGTQVYEARRTESLKIMTDTEQKRAKIDELLTSVRERLEELEEEKEELRAFQEKDKERRCLEYTIYNREQMEITRHLEAIADQRQTGVEETDDNMARFKQGELEIELLDKEIGDIKQRTELLLADKQQLEDERRESARDRAKVELEVKVLMEGQSAAQKSAQRQNEELREVQQRIRENEDQLKKVVPKYDKVKNEEISVKATLDDAEGVRQRLFAKQGRTSQFKTKQQRDTWLRKEIDEAHIAIANNKAVKMQILEENAEIEQRICALESEIKDFRARIDGQDTEEEAASQAIQRAKDLRDRLVDERKYGAPNTSLR